MNLWTPKYFRLEELVPPELFEEYRDKQWNLWLRFDNRILLAADLLREKYGPANINNWLWGGSFDDSGLRIPGREYYSPNSQHSFGRALDMRFRDADPETVRKAIVNREVAPGLISAIEADVSWNHIDSRLPDRSGQVIVFQK